MGKKGETRKRKGERREGGREGKGKSRRMGRGCKRMPGTLVSLLNFTRCLVGVPH